VCVCVCVCVCVDSVVGVCNRKRPKVIKQGGLCSTLLTCLMKVPSLNIAGDTVEFKGFHAFTQSLLANFGTVP
jgi:hypothetical protein